MTGQLSEGGSVDVQALSPVPATAVVETEVRSTPTRAELRRQAEAEEAASRGSKVRLRRRAGPVEPGEDPGTVDDVEHPAEIDLPEAASTTSPAIPARRRGVRSGMDRIASWLLTAAAVSVALGGVTLALGFPRPHTLMVYAAVGLGGLGVLLALPKAMSSVPFDPTSPTARRRSDDD
jgi:hypothetical protein